MSNVSVPQEKPEKIITFPGAQHVGFLNEYFRRSSSGFLPEIGRIKIGRKDESGRPRRLDHFILTFPFRGEDKQAVEDTELMKRIAALTGQKPNRLTRIPIRFAFDDPDLNLQVWFSCFKGGRQWCFGDGHQARRLRDLKGGIRETVPCPCERVEPEYSGPEKCKPFARLSCVVEGATRLGGVWVFRTTSWRSIRNLIATMQLYHRLTGGVLSGIRFWLTVTPTRASTPNGMQTIYVVNIEYWPQDDSRDPVEDLTEQGRKILESRLRHRINIEQIEQQVKERLASLPYTEELEAGEEIQDEFFPDNGDGTGTTDSTSPPQQVESPEQETSKPLTDPQRKMLTALLSRTSLVVDLDKIDFETGAQLISALQQEDMDTVHSIIRAVTDNGSKEPDSGSSTPSAQEAKAQSAPTTSEEPSSPEIGSVPEPAATVTKLENSATSTQDSPEQKAFKQVTQQQIEGLKRLAARMGYNPDLVDKIAPQLSYDKAANIFRTADKNGSSQLAKLLDSVKNQSETSQPAPSPQNVDTRWMDQVQHKAASRGPQPPDDNDLPF